MDEINTLRYNEPPFEVTSIYFQEVRMLDDANEILDFDMDYYAGPVVVSEKKLSFTVEYHRGFNDLITEIKERAWSENLVLNINMTNLYRATREVSLYVKDITYEIVDNTATLTFTPMGIISITNRNNTKVEYLLKREDTTIA